MMPKRIWLLLLSMFLFLSGSVFAVEEPEEDKVVQTNEQPLEVGYLQVWSPMRAVSDTAIFFRCKGKVLIFMLKPH